MSLRRHALFFCNHDGLVKARVFREKPCYFAAAVQQEQTSHFLSAGGTVFALKAACLQCLLVLDDVLDSR